MRKLHLSWRADWQSQPLISILLSTGDIQTQMHPVMSSNAVVGPICFEGGRSK